MKTIDELGKDIEKVKEKVVEISNKELTLMQQLDKWLAELVFPGDIKNFIQELEGSEDGKEIKRKLCFYTEEHQYIINAIERPEAQSYLGCGVLTRKERAGEDWKRGNDLPDGPFNKKTWNRIVYSIVNYELVKLTPFQRPDEIPEDVA